MGIKESNIHLGQFIEGACYCFDKYAKLIGWYDKKLDKIFIYTKYKHIKHLMDEIYENNIEHDFVDIVEHDVEEFFKQFHINRMKNISEHRDRMRTFNENMKLVPERYKKVKNAEQEIKKRHD